MLNLGIVLSSVLPGSPVPLRLQEPAALQWQYHSTKREKFVDAAHGIKATDGLLLVVSRMG